MSLVLEIEFLSGVCRAAYSPASTEPDWPPQPDRVFFALVSAWAARGERLTERRALEWLEGQPPPAIHAGGYTARTAPDVFVPPNDQRSSSSVETYLKVMPAYRTRQPRRFPVARLDDPVMELVWRDEPRGGTVVDALAELARDVSYIGHSSSLTRCRFVRRAAPAPLHAPVPARRRVYRGRLQELEREYARSPTRPVIRPGTSVPVPFEAREPASRAADWLILEAIGGDTPDIRAAALVGRTLRRSLMSGYRGIGMENEIPALVSGHAPDGSPAQQPHLAVAPMAFVGYPHADGSVFGYALIPPGKTSLRNIPGLRAAFEQVAKYDRRNERRVLRLNGVPRRSPLQLAPAGVATKRSLSPEPYLAETRVWASVTPIVLDRHLKRYDDDKVRELIADSCANAGLPRPDPARIQVGKHSAIEGSPPAWQVSGAPAWTRWRIPKALESRLRLHAVIDFGREVAGPVLLGAGRYTGLGLCRRLGS